MKKRTFFFWGMLAVMLILGNVDVFAQTQAPANFRRMWVVTRGNDEGNFIITATTIELLQNGKQSWFAEIAAWQEITNEGKNKQDYPMVADITLKVGTRIGPLQLFIHRDKRRLVMKSLL
jgi:hypothetical protein